MNPLEESFDVAVGAFPMSFASVVDVPLCPYDRLLVAAPGYLAARAGPEAPERAHPARRPRLPADRLHLVVRDRPQGPVTTEIRARFRRERQPGAPGGGAAGLGIAVLPQFLAREALESGLLVHVLPDFPLTPIWFKAMVPLAKVHQPEVAALVDHLKGEFGPVPPWDRPSHAQPLTNSCSFSDAANPSSASLTSPQCPSPFTRPSQAATFGVFAKSQRIMSPSATSPPTK